MTTPIQAIETSYAGCRFRSRLEARWAVFFDEIGAAWAYEPQGFVVGGRPYLPDFQLTDCGVWVEVKGSEGNLDKDLMLAAAQELPEAKDGPRLLILGPMPAPLKPGPKNWKGGTDYDWGWMGLDYGPDFDGGFSIESRWWGFGSYLKNRRPWVLINVSTATPFECDGDWLVPQFDCYESGVREAYVAARSARFEHGESGPRQGHR